MATCGSNTEMRRCGNGVRLLGVGVSSSSKQTQTKDNRITLQVGPNTITLRKRTRNATLQRSSSSTITGSFVCQSTYDSGWFHGRESQTDDADISLEEDYTTVDSAIIYMDLRKGIVLYEEETDTMKFSGKPEGSVTFVLPDGAQESRQVVMIPADTGYTAVEIDKINMEPHESKQTPYGLDWAMDLYIPLPWSTGLPKNDSPLDYLLYDEGTRQEFGGHDFYYPRWIQPVGVDHTDDDYEKAAHLALIAEALEGEKSGPGYRGFAPRTAPKGSIAYDRYGNQFMSYKNVLGKGTAKLIVQGIEIEIPKYTEADAWYPVSPI